MFRADAAQPFDDRCLSWQMEARTVSIWTVDGRLKGIPFIGRAEDLALLASHRKGESDLVRHGGDWFLVATVDVPEAAPNPSPEGFLGVDMGIVNIATTSDGANWSGGAVTVRRAKNKRLRARLQATVLSLAFAKTGSTATGSPRLRGGVPWSTRLPAPTHRRNR